MALDDETLELFNKMVLQGKKPKKKAAPKPAKKTDSPLAAEFKKVTRQVKSDNKRHQSGNGYDYVKVWAEDGSDYKYVPRARYVMALHLGREIPDHMRVFFKDKTVKGDAKYALENLVLGFKGGIPLDLLTCRNCGCRGAWDIESAPIDGDTDE